MCIFKREWEHLEIGFPVCIQNQIISGGLEPVLSKLKKTCVVSYHRQFCTSNRIKIRKLKLIPVLFALVFGNMFIINTMCTF